MQKLLNNGILPFHGGIPVVFDGIVRSPREKFGDLGPAVALKENKRWKWKTCFAIGQSVERQRIWRIYCSEIENMLTIFLCSM